MSRYGRDPRTMTARYPGTCAECGEPFAAGAVIFYYPLGRKALSGECADRASREFAAAAADEAFVSGGY